MRRAHVRCAWEVNRAPAAVTLFQQRIQEGYGKDPWYAGDNMRMLCKQHDLWWRGNAIAVPDHGCLRVEILRVLREFHSAPYNGHTGVNQMIQTLQRGCSQSCAAL